ncbi:MAG: hypothetical protein NTW74_20110 [Acidobacteria bacterium]|nr:hypothetical protein [Acidobacteriota bacterium]
MIQQYIQLVWFGAYALAASEETWVYRLNGQNILKLELSSEDGSFHGELTRPKSLSIDSSGDVTRIGGGVSRHRFENASIRDGQIAFTIDEERLLFIREGAETASLVLEGISPLKLQKVPSGTIVELARKLQEPSYTKQIQRLRKNLRAMVKADQKPRLAFQDSGKIDERHLQKIQEIFKQYGWVRTSLAGKDASHDFWLLVQHQSPEVQRQMLPALEKAANEGEASMSDYAYLYDRVQLGLGKPQRWGTQIKCHEGKPTVAEVEDPEGLADRRKKLFMMPVEEYLKVEYLIQLCAQTRTPSSASR